MLLLVILVNWCEEYVLSKMENNIEHEICNNCKKEIPQPNYVMHTIHCARNITLCKTCKEPIPKSQFSSHEKSCRPVEPKPLPPPLTTFEKSSYYQARKTVEDTKVDARKERYLQRMEKLVDTGYTLKSSPSSYNRGSYGREVPSYTRETSANYSREPSVESTSKYSSKNYNTHEKEVRENGVTSKSKTEVQKEEKVEDNATPPVQPLIKRAEPPKSSGMLACKYCDLDLPKLELEEHENYCGSRTDKCLECGELVMFKDKQAHMDSNHGHLKKKGGKRNVGWDSSTQRSEASSDTRSRRSANVRTFGEFDYDPMPYLPAAYQSPGGGARKKEGDSYKEISRRLDCPTGPPTPPPVYRRRNPPTELVIPCEFCNVPIPHEDLIQHETGCRPDLARLSVRRRRSLEDDYYVEPRQNSVDDEELPCEFCGDMIPASRLYSHQIQCN